MSTSELSLVLEVQMETEQTLQNLKSYAAGRDSLSKNELVVQQVIKTALPNTNNTTVSPLCCSENSNPEEMTPSLLSIDVTLNLFSLKDQKQRDYSLFCF